MTLKETLITNNIKPSELIKKVYEQYGEKISRQNMNNYLHRNDKIPIKRLRLFNTILGTNIDGNDDYNQGRADAIRDIRDEIANRVPNRPITERAIEVWEDKYWLLINLDKTLEQMQKGAEQCLKV